MHSFLQKSGSQLALAGVLAASLVVTLCAPWIDPVMMRILLFAGINIILAVSLNLINGHTGQFSLGHAAFMAVGAYGTAIVTMQFGSFFTGYDLKLVTVADPALLPSYGTRLVTVAKVDSSNTLHFRIYDPAGRLALDKAEADFPGQVQQTETLKAQLAESWGQPLEAGSKKKREILQSAGLITGRSDLAGMFGDGWFGISASFLTALLIGGGCAAICGYMMGAPSLRLRGDYLAIVTLGFNEIVRVIFTNTDRNGPFGGSLGLKDIPTYTNFFWVFGIAAVATYVVGSMVQSTYGRGFLAVRDDDTAAEAMGINTVRYKVIAFVIGAFFAGLAGGLYAHLNRTISPEGFGFMMSVEVVVMVILGGMGSTGGVIVAAILLTFMSDWLRGAQEYRMIIYSLMLIVLMISRPQGLLPKKEEIMNLLRRRKKPA